MTTNYSRELNGETIQSIFGLFGPAFYLDCPLPGFSADNSFCFDAFETDTCGPFKPEAG